MVVLNFVAIGVLLLWLTFFVIGIVLISIKPTRVAGLIVLPLVLLVPIVLIAYRSTSAPNRLSPVDYASSHASSSFIRPATPIYQKADGYSECPRTFLGPTIGEGKKHC